MITSKLVGNRTVFLTDTEEEWRGLVAKSHIVYTTLESQLCNQHQLGREILDLLWRLKITLPSALLTNVRTR